MRIFGLRSAKVTIISFAVLLATMVAMAGPAAADVGPGQVTHIYMDIDGTPSKSAADGYSAFINSLRSAAGHSFRGGTYIAQSNVGGIIRADIDATSGTSPLPLTLWIDPQNLYVLGYTAANSETLYFNDLSAAQVDRVAAGALAQGFHGGFRRLPFGGNYNALSAAAQRGRGTMPISAWGIFSAVVQLAKTNSGNLGDGDAVQNTACNLMLMIQVTSEAARFSNVFGIMSDALRTQGTREGLPAQEQNLENNWSAMSRYGIAVSNNSTTQPVTIVGAGAPDGHGHQTNLVLNSWSDVARYVGLLLGNLAIVGAGPAHTEL